VEGEAAARTVAEDVPFLHTEGHRKATMTVFRSRVSKLVERRDVDGLIALLGPLDKQDVKARLALASIGKDAVPALLSLALTDPSPMSDTLPAQVAAAHTVLVMIGEPTLRAVTRVITTSDDRRVVADAAELLYRSALELRVAVPGDVKEEVERKTGRDWATVSGEGLDRPD
jgi:hypothetical protein